MSSTHLRSFDVVLELGLSRVIGERFSGAYVASLVILWAVEDSNL